jgi:hypothetical protein
LRTVGVPTIFYNKGMKDERYKSLSFKIQIHKGLPMSRIKLQSLLKEKKQYPINGYTSKPYRYQNHHNLNESFNKNGFEYNIWLSENQCERLGIKVIDKSHPSYTIGRNGEEFKIYNISQTDFIEPKRKKSVSKPKVEKPSSDEMRIQMLEKMVIHLYDKLDYSISDVDLKDLL